MLFSRQEAVITPPATTVTSPFIAYANATQADAFRVAEKALGIMRTAGLLVDGFKPLAIRREGEFCAAVGYTEAHQPRAGLVLVDQMGVVSGAMFAGPNSLDYDRAPGEVWACITSSYPQAQAAEFLNHLSARGSEQVVAQQEGALRRAARKLGQLA